MQPDEDESLTGKLTGQQARDDQYWRRMLFIQKLRRTVLLVCLLLCIDAIVTVWRDPGLADKSHAVLLQSLFAFMIAFIIAVSVMTVRLRK